MNIQDVNNVQNPIQNTPVQETPVQPPQENQNAEQNQANREVNRDNYTPSQAADRMRELTGRREALQEELGALRQQPANQPEAGNTRTNEIQREINGIDREMRNMAAPENNAADRRQREAINRYTEQNQAAVRAQTTNNRNVVNLFGE